MLVPARCTVSIMELLAAVFPHLAVVRIELARQMGHRTGQPREKAPSDVPSGVLMCGLALGRVLSLEVCRPSNAVSRC